MRHDPLTPGVPARILSAMDGREWVNHFSRWAEKLAAEQERRTGYPLPKSEGFSAPAQIERKDVG